MVREELSDDNVEGRSGTRANPGFRRRRHGLPPKDVPAGDRRVGGGDGLAITVESGGSSVTVAVSGDLDAQSTPRLRSCLIDLVGRPDVPEVVIDLTQVTFCDSTALGVFVGTHRQLQSDERRLELRSPTPAVRHLFEVSGLDHVLHLS